MEYTPRDVEQKWQERWAEDGRYEVDPEDEEATFVTVPYPYPSGGMHIGHARTYTVPDVYARHAAQMGLKVVIDTDAHTTHDLDLMRFGVSMARRGWLESADIHNTNTKDEIVQSRQVKE